VRGYEDFTLDPKDGKGPRVEIHKRRAISILRRQPDGTWKTARGMTNSDAPPTRRPG
jgi:ketosteroid isomerase-like protein